MRSFLTAVAFVVGSATAFFFAHLAVLGLTTEGFAPVGFMFAASVVMLLRYMWLEAGA